MKRSGRKLWEGERNLYFRLLEKPMTWTELKRQTHFSNTTLAVYLKHLTELGYVHHDAESKTYRPLEYFQKFFPTKIGEAFRLIRELNPLWLVIQKHADAERQDEISEVTVRAHAKLLSAAIPLLLHAIVTGAFPRPSEDGKQPVRKIGKERP
jgi:DNA-binding transcriptional regulator GbsR (MarR family)